VRGVLHLLALAALLSSCADHVVYQQDVSIPDGIWEREFKPEFSFEITDTVSHHDLFIDVRHTGDYPFSDLFLFLDLSGPGDRHMRDTVQCLLADPSGQWYGRGTGFIFADRFHAHVLYKLRNRFPSSGRYTIRLEQAMRTERLPGVLDIGISVERSQAR
jgi:gliding motility-associated lipoprotein GldH